MNIADSLQIHAVSRGHHVAIEDRDERVTYLELLARVDVAAANLRGAGIGPRDLVGVMLPDSPDHIVVLYALAKLGAVSMAMDPRLQEQARAMELAGLDVRLIISDSGAHVAPIGRGLAVGAVCAARPPHSPSDSMESDSFDESQPAMLVQTSGTTGSPKRLLLTHAQVVARNRRQARIMSLSSSDRYLLHPSLHYHSGMRRCMTLLQIGGTVVVDRATSWKEELRALGARNITFAYAGPARLNQVLRTLKEVNGPDGAPPYPDLKLVVTGSPTRPSARSLARQKLTPHLFESYGTTEGGDLTVALPVDHARHPDSVGRLIEGVEAKVVDDSGIRLPPGEVGLIGFRAPDLPEGYIGNAEATAKGFRDGWFYPGDIASLNEDGYVFLKGRADDVINCNGAKFYPAEVEDVLMSHPAVADAAVIGRHYRDDIQVAVAFIVGATDAGLQELVEHCAARLASHKVPLHIEAVAKILRNPQGKVLKRDLKRDFERRYGLSRIEAGWVADARS